MFSYFLSKQQHKLLALFIVLLVGSFFSTVRAQDYPRPAIDIDNFIQELFSVQSEDINYEDVYETLFQFYRSPLNLNTASREDLESLFVLSELQINSLLKHININGKLLSIYEIQAIPHFDATTIYRLLPFVFVRPAGLYIDARPLWQRILRERESNYLILRYDRVLQKKKGFTPADTNSKGEPNSRYAGSPGRMYTRYRISHRKDFSLGFTVEKDDGEQLTWDTRTRRYGADFLSFHAFVENQGRLKALALGDYQLQFGQSLLLAGGFNIGKGAETVQTIRRSNLGIRPYTSTLESGFFRGVAATYQFNRIEVTGFYSYNLMDANVLNSGDTLSQTEAFIQSFQTSGFHRTATEINAKGNIGERIVGSNVLYRSKDRNFQAGAIMLHTRYSKELKREDRIYNRFEFNGQENYNLGAHLSYNWQNFTFFGEGAQSKSGGRGAVAGFVSSLAPHIELAMLYRNFDKNFHSFYGSALGEGSRNINEEGIYWGIKVRPFKKIQLAAYYDRFRFPWLRFQADAPSSGHEFLARASYKFSRQVQLFGQYREEVKQKNQPNNSSNIDFLINTTRRNYIINLNYRMPRTLTLHSRLQMSSYQEGDMPITQGYALVQDVGFKVGKFTIDIRFSLFDTEDFNNRQYVFEKDVLWAFSIPAYSGVGFRNYALVRYRLSRKINIWLRYAQFSYRNQNTVGSGLEEIQGSVRSEIKAQVRIKF
ncbi:ComEA family DNA-binding protein [Microscilla marina]|uniref:Helix-hairpin-helix motif domain protein n=1 Tax=Microscilla marina ATCC 23134 TaxID=313606 RepID=A1ZJ33_MICM2|nr:hypothetical protein [Microscilla marina]EAY29569.1 hypothetical protein M23134_00453 [Microscilla marina ATCC 23134]